MVLLLSGALAFTAMVALWTTVGGEISLVTTAVLGACFGYPAYLMLTVNRVPTGVRRWRGGVGQVGAGPRYFGRGSPSPFASLTLTPDTLEVGIGNSRFVGPLRFARQDVLVEASRSKLRILSRAWAPVDFYSDQAPEIVPLLQSNGWPVRPGD